MVQTTNSGDCDYQYNGIMAKVYGPLFRAKHLKSLLFINQMNSERERRMQAKSSNKFELLAI